MLIAVGKRVVVKEIVEKEVRSLIIIPKEKKQLNATVLAIGSECCPRFRVGDVVILPQECGVVVEIEGEKFLSIAENQILAAWRGE